MTTTQTAATTTSSLATILCATLPFASQDYGLPALTSVRIEAGEKVITATTTDRYTIGHARREASGTLPPFLVDAGIAKTLLDALRWVIDDRGHGNDPVNIDVTDGLDRRISFNFRGIGISATEVPEAGAFPHLSTIVSGTATQDAATLDGLAALSFHTIHRLHAAMEFIDGLTDWDSPPARWYFDGPTKPVRVEVGDWFLAVLMLVNVRGSEPSVPFGIVQPDPAEGGAR